MNTRRDLFIILLLAVGLVGFQLAFKKRPETKEVNQLKNLFTPHRSYLSQYAPDFALERLDGRPFKVSEQLGKNVVVLNFFATWCGPCRQEMPELEYFLDRQAGQPLVFLAIGVGADAAELRDFAKKLKIKLPMAADPDKQVAAQYRIRSFPTTVIIQPDGHIIMYESGAIANADVTLTPVVKMWMSLLRGHRNLGDLDAYRKAAPRQLPKLPGDADEDGDNTGAAAGKTKNTVVAGAVAPPPATARANRKEGTKTP